MKLFLKFFIVSLLLQPAGLLAQDRSGVFIIDDFENPNAYDNYQVGQGDQSQLTLSPSSDRLKGNYSLELSYYLKSSIPTGTYVALERYYPDKDYPDLRGMGKVGLLVKGDGSGNMMKVVFIDSDGELWEYENKSILNSVKWEMLNINFSDFKLSDSGPKKNGTFDTEQIKGYKITVYNLYSKTIQGIAVKSSQGNILVDYLYAVIMPAGGEAPAVGEEQPPEAEAEKKEGEKAKAESPIRFNGSLYSEYFNVPDQKNELMHWGRIDMNANYGLVSGKIVLAAEAQSFGDSAYRKDENDKYTGQVTADYPRAVVPFIQLRANNISGYIGNITVGNLMFEYSRYTFSPTIGYDDLWGIEKVTPDWGYKGISCEGNLKVFTYHAFLIKQAYDSFTYGARLNKHITDIRDIELSSLDLKLYYVGSGDTAQFTNDNSIRKTGEDRVYSLDLSGRFLDYQIGLEGFYAYNEYVKRAQVSYEDPYEPVYQQPLANKVSQKDTGYKAKIIFDGLLMNDFYLTYEYRHLGENFKPKNRMEPILFDDIDSDQNGHNALASYRMWGFTLTGEFDELKRISDTKYYRKRRSGTLGCSAFRNIFLSYFREWKREYYEYVSSRSYYNTARDDEIISQEFYVKAQLRYNLDLSLKLRVEDVEWPAEDKKFNSQSAYIKVNYYLASNFLVFGEIRTSRFGDVSWFSPGYNPYFDNFMRVGAMFNF
ncbi:MAG: CIA30 family protein [bacterium]|nr:CIA30 family protein [bacterium]